MPGHRAHKCSASKESLSLPDQILSLNIVSELRDRINSVHKGNLSEVFGGFLRSPRRPSGMQIFLSEALDPVAPNRVASRGCFRNVRLFIIPFVRSLGGFVRNFDLVFAILFEVLLNTDSTGNPSLHWIGRGRSGVASEL